MPFLKVPILLLLASSVHYTIPINVASYAIAVKVLHVGHIYIHYLKGGSIFLIIKIPNGSKVTYYISQLHNVVRYLISYSYNNVGLRRARRGKYRD